MMKNSEMKDVLYRKLQDENSTFKKSDISIKKQKDSYIITIKDYEHIPLKLYLEYDDYFGYVVYVQYHNGDYFKTIEMLTSKKDYDVKRALIYVGYYIGTRF